MNKSFSAVMAFGLVSLFSFHSMAKADESTGARTSADYEVHESSLNVGETSAQGNTVKKDKLEAQVSSGLYINDPDNKSASAGLSIGGKIKKREFITKIGNLSLSPTQTQNNEEIERRFHEFADSFSNDQENHESIRRAFEPARKYGLKGGILFAPGVEGNLKINFIEGAIDQASLKPSIGSAYRLEQKLPFGNWDANFATAGGELSYDRYMDITKAMPLTLKLGEGSFHGSWTIRNVTDGKETAAVQFDPYAQLGLFDIGFGYSRSRSGEGFGSFSPIDMKLGLATSFPSIKELGSILTELSIKPVEVVQGPDAHKVGFKIGVDGIGGNTKVGRFGVNYEVDRDWTNVDQAMKVNDTTHIIKFVNDDHDVTRHMLNVIYTPDFQSAK